MTLSSRDPSSLPRRRVHAHRPLDTDTARRLNPAAEFGALKDEALQIGYPLAG